MATESLGLLWLEAAKLYHDALDGDGSSKKWAALSPMQLLWVLTVIIRQRCAYKFFKRATDDAVLTICSSLETEKIKATALFFASIVANDLGDESPFELLLEQFKPSSLPFPVAIAIHAESSGIDRNRIKASLKAYNKKVRRMIEGSGSARDQLKMMFDVPIRARLGKRDKKGKKT